MVTAVGIFLAAAVLLPSCNVVLEPQQYAVPVVVIAQL